MATSQFIKSKASLLELQKLLTCNFCQQIALNPHVLGNCDHTFCLECANNLAGEPCVACDASSSADLCQPDRVVEDLLEAFLPVAKFLQLPLSDNRSTDPIPDAAICQSKESSREKPETEHVADQPTADPIPGTSKKANSKERRSASSTQKVSPPNESSSQIERPGTASSGRSTRSTKKQLNNNVGEDSPGPILTRRMQMKRSITSSEANTIMSEENVASTSNGPVMESPAAPKRTPVASSSAVRGKAGTSSSGTRVNKERKKSVDSLDNVSVLSSTATRRNSLDTSSFSGFTTPLNSNKLNKRNAKGETPLHVACVKQEVLRVKELLALGADPNTQDNAGWTPLHETVILDSENIAELLLSGGANPNVPGGKDNVTPLHDAVFNRKLKLVRLLVARGADLTARNSKGQTPVDLCPADDHELKAALDPAAAVPIPTTAPQVPERVRTMVVHLYLIGIEKSEQKKLTNVVRALGAKLMTSYSTQVTHVALRPDDPKVKDYPEFYSAVLQGQWICDYKWIQDSKEAKQLADPDLYELNGCLLKAYPEGAAGRLNASKQLPGLFNNCSFFLYGTFSSCSKTDVAGWIKHGGGQVLSREPKPESISPNKQVPYHAQVDGILAKCSHYIVYDPKNPPQIKYNMAHIKTLPVDWLISCIENFALVDLF